MMMPDKFSLEFGESYLLSVEFSIFGKRIQLLGDIYYFHIFSSNCSGNNIIIHSQ